MLCFGSLAATGAAVPAAAPIIGGYGDFRYQYMPDLLQPPPGASLKNCHGLVTDKDKNIYLTYENDGVDKNCLIKWKPDGTGAVFMTGGANSTLCEGTPHGLKIVEEGGEQYLYHANNAQRLTKTTLDGSVVWQREGNFGQDPSDAYRPTWFAVPPKGNYIYLCDGYGSNHVFTFDRTDGTFLNHTWGGKGGRDQHGKFSTNHGCTWDPRVDKIVVSDRANSRFEFFDYDPATGAKFEYSHTVDMRPSMGAATLPCNLRMYPDQSGRAIIPDLSGPVAVLDDTNQVISVVNVSVLLAAEQHNHPHDAIFLPNGDMVVATWNPGRISYWKKL
jgi:DNA-binding beta-propeller fold protein YncE